MFDKIVQGVRRLGLGSPEAPVISGMDVMEWRVNEIRSGSTVDVLCHKDSRLYVMSFKQSCPDEKQIDEIDLTTVFPSYKAQFALYHQKRLEDKDAVKIKRTQILNLVAAAQDPSGACEVAPCVVIDNEASICNRLMLRMSQPHPNILHFLYSSRKRGTSMCGWRDRV